MSIGILDEQRQLVKMNQVNQLDAQFELSALGNERVGVLNLKLTESLEQPVEVLE